VDEVLGQRYSVSSDSSICTAISKWDECRSLWNWPQIILSGSIQRGAMLATFVIFLMELRVARGPTKGQFYPAATISNYVWGLCAFMIQKRQIDPRINVINWPFFMAGMAVMCHVPSEPRKRVPFELILQALHHIDKTNFAMVQMAVFVLMLFFTFQRAEFPCAQSLTTFNLQKQCRVCDMEPFHGGSRWAIGATKADPRAERPSGNASPGREWIVIGEVQGIADLRIWLNLFYGFFPHGPREPSSPFFRSPINREDPLTYDTALKGFRSFLSPVCSTPADYGLHGIRIEGYNTCKNAVSELAAIVTGGWHGSSNERYDRLQIDEQFSIASKMLNFHLSGSQGTPEGIIHGSRESGISLHTLRQTANVTAEAPSSSNVGLPPNWTSRKHTTPSGRLYTVYEHASGLKARSIKAAWISSNSMPASSSLTVSSSTKDAPHLSIVQSFGKRRMPPEPSMVITHPSFKGKICGSRLSPTNYCSLKFGHIGNCC